MILEGGSVDVNGSGLGLSTEACLLNPNRNPNLERADIAAALMRYLGLDEIVWLGDGIAGDDTDGHIDNLARFVGENCIVAVTSEDPADPDHRVLARNLARLVAFRDERRPDLEIVPLPVPDPIVHEGRRLPASYANFYIANELVLVPAFGAAADSQAQAILADCFPDRRIVPIDCRALIVGLGALHCLTQQIPVIVPDSTPA
jgi:agmatine deiminase